ncbi:MAG: VCBS repeat-containing protein, partial [Myxococcota bacterium]
MSLGQPDGGFAAPLTTSVAAFVASRPPRVGDVDEDGFPDVVYFADGATSASVLLGRGDGSLAAPLAVAAASGATTLADLALGDLDRDGHLDLVEVDRDATTGYLRVLLGRGD